MNTAFLLMAEYESAVVPLSQISQKYFGLAPQTAKFRANAGKLPVPVFRASQKAEYLVSIQDLAAYIDRMREGAKQGLISGGCNTKDSMGNRYQETHTDQITVLACHYSLSKLPNQHGVHHDGIQITKPKDKASPLLATAFARQEHLEGSIDFYRTNDRGHYERFYSIAFQKAVVCEVTDMSPHVVHCPGEEMHEMITFRYKGVQWEHFPCGTLAYDGWTDANSLAAMAPPLSTAERYAKQMEEMVQAEKTAEQQAAKAQQSRQKSILTERPETEAEKKPVPQRFARSVTVPDGTCEVGMQRESLSGIGQYAAYALAIERTGEQMLS